MEQNVTDDNCPVESSVNKTLLAILYLNRIESAETRKVSINYAYRDLSAS